ncbi:MULTISPECIES: GOLPH3/VPS74 family protein [Cellulomonas]|uniref:GOLPH3/VPS74 family protein n=1 Tax=Cellulomonas TaxID=1707 RepID=UPI0010A8DDE0|nr:MULTISPECIES: GPP34 family phosphoprotein [Cellulomonas]
MIAAEDVLLLLTDDATGKPLVDGTRRDIAVAGAVIAQLATEGRLDAVTSSGLFSRTTLRVVDATPLGDEVLDEALRRAAGPGSASPTAVLDRIRKGLRERLYDRLAARGVLRADEGRVLGIFPTTTWPAVDSAHEAQVRRGLHDVLVTGRAPTPREASLVALLAAVDALPKVLPGTGLPNRELKARAKRLAAGDVGGEAARKAVEAVQSAMIAAVAAGGAAAAASSG